MFPQRLRYFIILTFLIVGLTACNSTPEPVVATALPASAAPETPSATSIPAAAKVNGEVITVAEFEAEVARFEAAQAELGYEITMDEAVSRVMEELIDQVLLAQGAKAAGFTVDETLLDERITALTVEIGGAEAMTTWIQAQGYTEADFRSALRRALAAAWMRDQIITSVPMTTEQVHVRQILLYNEERAQNVLAQLQSGSDFDELAALFDPVTRGELGWFPRGYIFEPALEEAAFALQAGQFSDIVETTVGFHIIKVLARETRALSPDAYLTLQEKALEAWLTQQRELSTITLAP